MVQRSTAWTYACATALSLFVVAAISVDGSAADTNASSQPSPAPRTGKSRDLAPEYPPNDFGSDASYAITRVIDGDTVEIQYRGAMTKVRLIGVDTPETVHPDRPVEPYGPEASEHVKNCLAGERVYLRFGDEETDKYGRMLAYVFRAPDGMFVNLELVRQGYGRAYIRYPFEHMALFQAYETRAMESRKGLWGLSETGE